MNNKKIILASASPRRNQLLQMLGLDFKAVKPDVDEEFHACLSVEENLFNITKSKALYVKENNNLANCIIISADTIVLLEHNILTKPADTSDAFNMLKSLSGNWHKVITGVYVTDADTDKETYKSKTTKVKFRILTDDEIYRYISTGEADDKAGAYGIQGLGSLFVESIEGCYYNVVGLPLVLLDDMLKKFNINIL
ncbi:MAG: Maf family protein [Eubacteriaceae bacterium]